MAVRSESVKLSLIDDGFTSGMARAAAATALLDRNLNSLDGSQTSSADSSTTAGSAIRKMGDDSERSGKQIDKLSGRLALMAQAASVLGPALVPLGAATVPVLGALTAGLGAAAGALGVTLLATTGLGDAFDALNAAQLEPTTENIGAMRAEFERIGPDATQFVKFIDSLGPQLTELQMTARAGLFPGVEDGISSLLSRLPQVSDTVRNIAQAMGDLAADAGDALASTKFDAFFDYMENKAGPILSDFGRAAGNVFETIANVMVALDPATQSFTEGLLDKTRELAEWSRQLGTDQGFQSFLNYVRESGPQALDFIGTLVTSLAQVVEAVAPLGSVVLPILTQLVEAFGALAGSDIGSPIFAGLAALSLYNRALATTAALSKTAFVTTAKTGGAAGLVGMINPYTAAVVAATGLTLALVHANDELQDSISAVNMAGAGDPLADLIAKRQELIDQFVDTTTDGGFMGNLSRISSFLSGDDIKTEAAVARIDAFIAARRELNSLDKVDPLEALSEYFGDLNGVVLESTSLFYDFADAVAAAMGILDDRAAVRNYEAAIDAVNASLKENGKTLDVNTAKGRANQETLDDIARTGLQVADSLKGDKRRTFLDGLRESLRDAAQALGATKPEIRSLLDDLGLLDKKKVRPDVDLDTSQFEGRSAKVASLLKRLDLDQADPKVNLLIGRFLAGNDRALARLRALGREKAEPSVDLNADPFYALFGGVTGGIRTLDGTKATPSVSLSTGGFDSAVANVSAKLAALNGRTATTYIRTVTTGGQPMGGQAPNSAADGGTVPKTSLPYADRHLYLLADGEEVISNRFGEADAYRAAKGIPPARRLAAGGTAGFSEFPTNFGRTPDPVKPTWEALVASIDGLAEILPYLSKKELKIREHDLNRTSKQLDRLAGQREAQAQKELDADKNRLDSIKQAQQAFADQVAGLYDINPFAQRQGSGVSVGLPDNFADLTREEQLQQYAIMDQANAALTAPRTDALVVQNAANSRMAEALSLYKALRARGFDGPAFRALVGSGDVETLRAYSALPKSELAAIERSVNQGARLQQQIGQFVGNAEFGAQVRAQTAVVKESVAYQKETAQAVRALQHEVESLKKQLGKAADRVGDKVGDKLNGAAAKGARSR